MLKALELFGFKSFADRTRFDFAPGVTCVVGPNGSGKSNVVDALKWILGDQSAKSLRGKEMTDVIFNGSSSRKPSGFAEATLTFDNSSGLLPIDAQEVQIGRRIWRNGDAEYLLNRAPSRLKDIRDLFLGTGAGSSAYSIIEQGRVDQILQANPASRRGVFEEAAGISRFKARKVDAQKKLERVAQNLERLTDIVDEVEAQLNATRNQAAKAAKFREVDQELRTWWFGLAADDHRRQTREIVAIESRLTASAGQMESLTAAQKELEAEEAAFDARLGELDDQLREAEKLAGTAREAIAGHETAAQYQMARLQELEAELTRAQKQQALLGQRTLESERQLEQERERISRYEHDLERNRERCQQHDAETQQARDEGQRHRDRVDSLRQRREELRDALNAASQQIALLESRRESSEERRARVAQQVENLQQALLAQQTRLAEAQAHVDTLLQTQQGAQQSLRDLQQRRQSLLHAQDEAKRELAQLREQRIAGLARKSLLEDLELRQEGLAIGTKEILTRARQSPNPPWNSVIGNVADILDVRLEHAALLEVALGPRSQLIVLREYQAFLDYLRQGTNQVLGRVGFLAIPERGAPDMIPPVTRGHRLLHLPVDPTKLPDLATMPGVIGRADGLIISENGIAGLAAAVLADTWVVETIEAGAALASTTGRGCRFVTLQGELIEANGALQVGTVRSETAILSRKTELRQLKVDLTQLDRQIATRETALRVMGDTVTGADGELARASEQLDGAQQQLLDAKAIAAAREQDVERVRREQETAAEQFAALQSDHAGASVEWQAAQRLRTQTETDLAECDSSLTHAEQEFARFETESRRLDQQRAADQLELATQSERLDALRGQLQRMEEDLEHRRQQADEAGRRCSTAKARQEQTTLELLNTRAMLNEQVVVSERWQAELTVLHQRKSELRQQRSRLVEHELKVRQQRRELADQRHGEELRLRELKHGLQALAERLDEEYQVRPEELADAGHSAYHRYLRERTPDFLADRNNPAASTDVETTSTATTNDEAPSRSTNPPDDSLELSPEELLADQPDLPFEQARPELESRVNRLRRKLKTMGAVNTSSLEDLEALEERFQQLSGQLQDLVEAKATLEDIIRRINGESKRMFLETFNTIRGHFQDLFRKVFGGGEGDVILESEDDVLECGIEIKARPPGKELRSLSLLSGGEKTMTAIALIMAIFRTKPSPFCILDEVDAALDEANVERFAGVVREFQATTQFVMITHHKRSMTVGDVLYGVTMEESGVSKRMSVRFEDVTDDGHFRTSQANAA